jgi:uncharacterized coiled-coil protein SlyX
MPGNDRENPAADRRLAHLESLLTELQRTVEQLDSVVRAQGQRLDWIEQQLLHWRCASGVGQVTDEDVEQPNPGP